MTNIYLLMATSIGSDDNKEVLIETVEDNNLNAVREDFLSRLFGLDADATEWPCGVVYDDIEDDVQIASLNDGDGPTFVFKNGRGK